MWEAELLMQEKKREEKYLLLVGTFGEPPLGALKK